MRRSLPQAAVPLPQAAVPLLQAAVPLLQAAVPLLPARAACAAALAVAFVISACGGGGGGRVVVRWSVGRDPSGGLAKLEEAFEAAHPGIDLEVIEMSMDVGVQHTQYVTQLVAGDPGVDLYALDVIWTAEFAEAGWLLPLDEEVEAMGEDDFLAAPLRSVTYRRRRWAVPWFTDAGVLYGRKDLLEEAGETMPATWEELARLAERMKTAERAGLSFQGARYEGLVCDFLEVAWSEGGGILDAEGNVRLARPENDRAARFLARLVRTAAPPGVLAHKEEESRRVFTEGKAVFLRNWPYVATLAEDTKTSAVAGKVVFAPPPGGPAGRFAVLGGWNVGVSAYSKHPEAARKVARFLASKEAQRISFLTGGRLPVRKSLYEDPDLLRSAPYLRGMREVLEAARPRPVLPNYAEVSDVLQEALHRILAGRATPEEAFAEADRAL